MTQHGVAMKEERANLPTPESSAPSEPPKLDYAVPAKKSYGKDLDRLIRRLTPPTDPDLRRWWWRRFVYRVALFLLFAMIALYFGPNLLEFGKFTRPTMADYVPLVEQRGVPKALKLYKLDHGQYPDDESSLVPDYLPERIDGFVARHGSVIGFVGHGEIVRYDAETTPEEWYLYGPWLSGSLPLPPVTVNPSPRPRTRPAG